MLELIDKDVKSAIVNTFKGLKETMSKEKKKERSLFHGPLEAAGCFMMLNLTFPVTGC